VNLAALTACLGVRRGPAAPPRRTVAADYAAPPAAEVLARRIALAEAVESEGVALYAYDGNLLVATPALERLVAARAVSLAGDGLLQRVEVGDRPAFLRGLANAVADADDAVVEVRCRRGGDGVEALDDGGWIDLDVRFRRTAPGDPVGPAVIARLTDASARRADADEIRRLREALSATIAGRSRELGLVGHEIRTPLSAILGFADALGATDRDDVDAARVREYAGLIGEAGRHLMDVVGGLLDQASAEIPDEGTPEAVELEPLLERCRRMMAPVAAGAGIDLALTVSEALPPVLVEPRACRQIVINLVSNAIKFTDRAGRVVLSAERAGERVRVVVRDTGIGIAPADIGRLGTPFMRLSDRGGRRREGAGLGLSVVKALAAVHGGTLDIRSMPGSGTTVTVDLPTVAAPATGEMVRARA
jgi:cell cycle sensor histidine kinase DivJ